MNENNYILSVKRTEICDLMMACTSIIISARVEMKTDPTCSEYRKNHVLPHTIEKWQRLHDKLKAQLDILDALNVEA